LLALSSPSVSTMTARRGPADSLSLRAVSAIASKTLVRP
jgi:hypothetical protein